MRKPAAKKVVRVGTRGSLLAMAQAGEIKRKLEKKSPKLSFRLVVIQTRGDEFQVGVFTKAIEEALLKNRVDIAVHSLKDLPTELPKGLCLAAFPKRLDPGDVLISKRRYTLQTLPKNAVVGTTLRSRFARPPGAKSCWSRTAKRLLCWAWLISSGRSATSET